MIGGKVSPAAGGRGLAKVFVGVGSRTGPRSPADMIRRMRRVIEAEGYQTGHFAATDIESIWVLGHLMVDHRFREVTKDGWLRRDGAVTVEVEGIGGADVKAGQRR